MNKRHMLNHSRLHNRKVRQRSNLHVSTFPSHSLSQKLPPTLTSTIHKSHGEQGRRESVHWPIEHRKLLQSQQLPQLPSLNLSLYPNLHLNLYTNLYTNLYANKKYSAQVLQLHMLKINPMRPNPMPPQRRLCIRRNRNLLLHTKRHPEGSTPPRSNHDLLVNPLLRTSPDRILHL